MKKILAVLFSAVMCLAMSSCVMVNTGYTYDNHSEYKTGGAEIADEILYLDVSWVAGSVSVVEYEGESISFEEDSAKPLTAQKKMRYWYDRSCKTLFIKFCESSFHINDLNKNLYIYVPKGYVFNKVDFDVVSSDVSLKAINSTVFKTNSVSGDLTIETGATESIEVNSVSGDLFVTAAYLDALDFDTVSGNCDISLTSGKYIEMDSVSGDLNLYLPKELGFYLEANTRGRIDYNMEVGRRGKTYTYGSKELHIDYDSTSGDVSVNN